MAVALVAAASIAPPPAVRLAGTRSVAAVGRRPEAAQQGGFAAAAAIAVSAVGLGAGFARRRSPWHLRRGRGGRATARRASSLRRERKVWTPADCVPEEILSGQYGREAEMAFAIMNDAIHVSNMAMLCMEEKKDKSAIGLHGQEVEREFVRTIKGGSKMTIAHTTVMASACKRLMEALPDDPILCEEDTDLLVKDQAFAETTAKVLSEFKLIESATPEDAARWIQHAGTYKEQLQGGNMPSRYWAFTPICTSNDFMQSKQFCMSLALIVDKQPVVAVIGCPVLVFDHAMRSVPHPSGVPFFFAVKGQGAFTQLVITERENGVYMGKSILKAKPLPLKVEEKIKRGNDGLYDVLGTNQLRIAQCSRLREDIFCDAERVGKILGSEFPKFDMTNSSIKYCWLARGETDIVWYLANGLFDKTCGERLVHHAAGALIAEESGAVVADLDGKPIDWCGPVLENNRGFIATDPGKVPIMGLVKAVEQATKSSEELYEKRCEKRKEVAQLLKHIFTTMGDHAETEEEREGARKVKERGLKMLSDDDALDEIAQESTHRAKPLLGESQVRDDTFDNIDDGSIPLSPIGGN